MITSSGAGPLPRTGLTPTPDEIQAIERTARRARNLAINGMFRNTFSAIGRAVDAALDWLSRPREPSLIELDDRMLKDIGLTRAEALTASKLARAGKAVAANRNGRQQAA
jgi:uncharacterized protein YjiS (DUF1127 family)